MTQRHFTRRSAPPPIDRIAVRRFFARVGEGDPEIARAAQLARDVLLDRLGQIRIAPSRILDLGAGAGATADGLARRFRDAEVVSVDPVVSLLSATRRRRSLARYLHVAGEAERLPLSSHSVDLIVSSLAMPWFDPVDEALAECLRTLRPGGLLMLGTVAECLRTLRPGGLLMLGTVGPDILKELALAWAGGGESHRMHPFPDMHALGDTLVRAGFADVVMDVERIRYAAPDFRRLCQALGRSGGSSAPTARRRGLSAADPLHAAGARYDSVGDPDGALSVSAEFVFGHAWTPERSRSRPSSVHPRTDWSLEPGSRS